MILSRTCVPPLGGDLFLKEVSTREEAYAEMRRYLEVNGIESDETTVARNRTDASGNLYEDVCMGASFRIYFKGEPIIKALEPEESFPFYQRDSSYSNVVYMYYSLSRHRIFWYDELRNYFNDLEQRVGGERKCH